MRPELLGRIDEIVVFDPLTEEDYAKIAAIMLSETKEALAERAITLSYTDEALKLIAKKAYGHKLGGRDIRRVIREQAEDKLAEIIIDRGEGAVKMALIGAEGDDIIVKVE